MSIGSEITSLLLNQGNIAAQRAQQQGQITAQTIGGITQAAQGAVQTLTDPKRLEYERSVKGRQALAAALKTTPPKADGTPDYEGIAASVGKNGFPDVGESFLSTASKNQENLSNLDKFKREAVEAQRKLQEHTMQTIGDAAYHAQNPVDFQSAVGVLHAHGQVDDKMAVGLLQAADQGGPDGWKSVRDKYLQFSPSWQKEQDERNKPVILPRAGSSVVVPGTGETLASSPLAPEKPINVAPGGTLIDPKTNQPIYTSPAAPASVQTENVLLDGKPAKIMVDPKTKVVTDLSGKVIDNPATRVRPIPTEGQINRDLAGQDVKLSDGQKRIASDLATGVMSLQQFNRMMGTRGSSPAIKQAMYLEARDINPDFNPVAFEAGQRMFSNPQIRQRMTAIDQLTPVINRITELANKASNTDIPALNRLIQSGKYHIGDTTVTDLRQMQTLLGDEVGNALGVGTGSDLKTRLGIDLVNTSLGPKQFASTMRQLKSVLGARRNALAQMMGPYAKDTESKSEKLSAADLIKKYGGTP